MDNEIKKLYSSENARWIGSEHVAFLPCRKLSCPQNLLYSPERQYGYDYNYSQLEAIVRALGTKAKIDFVIEFVVKKYPSGFRFYQSTAIPYDFSKAITEDMPNCAQIREYLAKFPNPEHLSFAELLQDIGQG